MDEYSIARTLPSFEDYLNEIIGISNESPLEIGYQYKVIMNLLENILPDDYQIVDTSKNKDTDIHTRKYYTFTNTEENDYPSPDIIIAKNYVHKNINAPEPTIYASIEAKRLTENEMFKKNIDDYSVHLIYELSIYLCANENNNRVIATNCRRWQFFKRTESFDVYFVKFFAKVYKYFGFRRKENVISLLESIESESKIKKMLDEKIKTNKNASDNEKAYAYKMALDEIARKQIESCCVNTIDVISNSEEAIKVEDFTEIIEPDEYVKELIGLKPQTRIKTPEEWIKLIDYIPAFIYGEV